MRDPSDFDLHRTDPPPPPPPPSRPALPWAAVAIVAILGIGVALYFFLGRDTAGPEPPADFTEATVPADPQEPLGTEAPQVEVPPLGESDPVVRRLIRELSSHPRVAAWLATDNLVRSFTVAVDNVARGEIPATALRALRPSGEFEVIESETELRIDPRSFSRYDELAAAVDSIDPHGAAQVYTILKPRIEEAYAELGTGMPFDQALERAIVSLLRVPALEGDVRLVPQGGVFGFEDPRVEGLTQAQKQLARMGPRNVRIIQDKLRAIGLALGIPPERLR